MKNKTHNIFDGLGDKMKRYIHRTLSFVFGAILMLQLVACSNAGGVIEHETGFELIQAVESTDYAGTLYYFRHIKTGAQVVFLDDGLEKRTFSIGFKTPLSNSMGANHVLEHSLLCGSSKYPTKNIMSYVSAGSLADLISAYTVDDCTYYTVTTSYESDYYNVIDVYMNGIFDPLLLTDKNIFYQEGIRLEYLNDELKYNGVVYNELRLKGYDSTENSLNLVEYGLYSMLYGETPPAFNSGGTVDAIKELTYDDVLTVYEQYYNPSNCMVYFSGKQDMERTLALLDGCFSKYDRHDMSILFENKAITPAQEIIEQSITAETKTVDIGFMSAGIQMSEGIQRIYAREILFDYILSQMEDSFSNIYSIVGNNGGIQNTSLIVSSVPVEEKDAVINKYRAILNDLTVNGFDDAILSSEIDSYINLRLDKQAYSPDLEVFNGIMYADDPQFYLHISDTGKALQADHSFFDDILQECFINNPNKAIYVYGNGDQAINESVPILTSTDMEQIKENTAAFSAWSSVPDTPEVIAAVPRVTINDLPKAPNYFESEFERLSDMTFYFIDTESDETTANLYFPINIAEDELPYLYLLTGYLSMAAENAGFDSFYFDISPMEDWRDSEKISPMLIIGILPNTSNSSAVIDILCSFLSDDSIWDKTVLNDFIVETIDDIIHNSYAEPYYIAYALKQSGASAGARFYENTCGTLGQGSIPYYEFLCSLKTTDLSEVLKKLNTMEKELLTDSKPTVEYMGTNGYSEFRDTIIQCFGNGQSLEAESYNLPMGEYPIAIVSNRDYKNHFMLTGYPQASNFEYSGKMEVLAAVLESRYLLPNLRGVYGAYGATMSIYNGLMTCSVSGLEKIDDAMSVWRGMGDYLRSLDMTQDELDAIIVKTVKEYDEYRNDSINGAQLAICGKTVSDIRDVRNEILETTVDDIRAFADFVDEMVGQRRVYAVLNANSVNSSAFDFDYCINAQTLEISLLK